MLHVWTLWTRPWHGQIPSLDMLSLQLSVRLVAARGHTCVLYCDGMAEQAVRQAKLPVQIRPALDGPMQHMPPEKWAAAKIHTYSLQSGPFVHVDHDLFLFQDPPAPATGVVAQHLENLPVNEMFYRRLALDFYEDTGGFPPDVGEAIGAGRPWGYNCGYLSAWDAAAVAFLGEYSRRAWDAFVRMRTTCRKNCAFAEQLVLQAMAWARGVPVHCLLPTDPQAHARSAAALGYVHLGGRKFHHREKTQQWVIEQLARL